MRGYNTLTAPFKTLGGLIIMVIIILFLLLLLFNDINFCGTEWQCRAQWVQECVDSELFTREECILLLAKGGHLYLGGD